MRLLCYNTGKRMWLTKGSEELSILICGGAGYIGSHALWQLSRANEDVIVVDNLSAGHLGALKAGLKVKFYEADIRDRAALSAVFAENDIEAVVHFAADSLVGRSMLQPLKYYDNNVGGMCALLDVMVKHSVGKIIFSSTAAVYGEPKAVPITEKFTPRPTNTYGETKLAMEKMMKWVNAAYGIKYVSLRYFNAAGAEPAGQIGEDHAAETHLIPLVLQVPLKKREEL